MDVHFLSTQGIPMRTSPINCLQCGQMLLVSPKGYQKKYCSPNCAWAYVKEKNRKIIRAKCAECKSPIPEITAGGRYKPPCMIKSQKFCSLFCRGKNKGRKSLARLDDTKNCLFCSKALVRKNKELLCHWSVRKFCDIKCVGKHNRNSYIATSKKSHKRWSTQAIYSRTGIPRKCCTRCNEKTNLHYHHKDRNKNNNAASNIEVLCSNCHVAEHKTDPVSAAHIKGIKKRSKKHIDRLRGKYSNTACENCGKNMWRLAHKRFRLTGRTLRDTLKYKHCSVQCGQATLYAKKRY